MLNKYKKHLIKAVQIAIALSCLYYLLNSSFLNIQLIMTLFHNTQTLFIAFLVLPLTLATALRWHMFLMAQKIRCHFYQTSLLTYIGLFFNYLIPTGSMGGDIIKCFYLCKANSNKKTAIISTIFADRATGLASILTVLAVTTVIMIRGHAISHESIILHYLREISIIIAALSSLGLALLYILFRIRKKHLTQQSPFSRKITLVINTLNLYWSKKSYFLLGLITAIGIQLIITTMLYLIAHMFHLYQPTWLDLCFANMITQLINMIPITPAGIGTGDLAFATIIMYLQPSQNLPYASIFIAYRIIVFLLYTPAMFFYSTLSSKLANSNLQQTPEEI